jgi:hypothetical protein
MRDGYQRRMKGVFIDYEAPRRCSNGCHFGPCTPTQVHHFENRASCANCPDGQANCPTF